ELSESAKRFLARKGWDPVMGARPLRRTIQREIEDALSERILFNELRPGQVVLVDCEGDPTDPEHAKLTFTGQPKPREPKETQVSPLLAAELDMTEVGDTAEVKE